MDGEKGLVRTMYGTRPATIQAGDHVAIICILLSFIINNSAWISAGLNGRGI
jgi:hypothetical protein